MDDEIRPRNPFVNGEVAKMRERIDAPGLARDGFIITPSADGGTVDLRRLRDGACVTCDAEWFAATRGHRSLAWTFDYCVAAATHPVVGRSPSDATHAFIDPDHETPLEELDVPADFGADAPEEFDLSQGRVWRWGWGKENVFVRAEHWYEAREAARLHLEATDYGALWHQEWPRGQDGELMALPAGSTLLDVHYEGYAAARERVITEWTIHEGETVR